MHRWERSHGRIGVSAPSWLTFELYRPYFDGGGSTLTPIQWRGPLVAARRFADRQPLAAQHAMLMPTSFRQLLVQESRLASYQVQRPTDLAEEFMSADWRMMADAYRRRDALDPTDRAGLLAWLTAVCLPDAVLDMVPADHPAADCADVLTALAQYARCMAVFQRGGLSPQTSAAFEPLVREPAATIAHVQAAGVWSYLLARHATEASNAADHAATARCLLDEVAGELSPFARALWRARMPLREVTLAERRDDLDEAWRLVEAARAAHDELRALDPGDEGDRSVAAELHRRIIDKRVEIAVKRGDTEAERDTIAEGVALDPYCIKIRMQEAQAAQRRGDLDAALTGFLLAARLGPFGTAFALLQAASCAGRLGREDVAQALAERAYQAAPHSTQTTAALVRAATTTGHAPLAEMVREPADGYRANWHYRMYGVYFNLGGSGSPCIYAHGPEFAYAYAVAGEYPTVDLQRVMAPAFRLNLARESGMPRFAVHRPADLPADLRTGAWEQLCGWVADFPRDDPQRQLLTCKVLYHLGFRQLLRDLLPERPASSLREPVEFQQYVLRELAGYAEESGHGRQASLDMRYDMIDQPDCPLYLRFTGATFAVVFAGRDSKSIDDATRWHGRAAEYLTEVLASPEFTEFDKVMMHSRYYRGVGFLPFLRGDNDGLVDDMAQAEKLARQVPAATPWQEYLYRENLHACLESRAKEALRLGDPELAHQRYTEALAIDPYHPMSNIELAESFSRRQLYPQAAASYLRGSRFGPYGTPLAYNMAGESYRRAGDATMAEDCFIQALRIDPYAVSAARGWAATAKASGSALADLATEYADALQAWGAQRREARAAAAGATP